MALREAVTPLLIGLALFAAFLIGRFLAPPDPDEGGIAYATVDIKCGKTTWRVSTGNNKGTCEIGRLDGKTDTAAFCSDEKGNVAGAACDLNGGEGGCQKEARGSGSCTKVPD